jgi:transcriptional regulator with XRE-family HTH domain
MRYVDFFGMVLPEELVEAADVEYMLARVAGRAFHVKKESGLSYRKIAKKMGTSPGVIQRIVRDAEPHNVTLLTLARFSQACGYEMFVEFRPKK